MNIDSLQIDKMLEWLKTKLKLDALSVNAKRRTVKRGQVYRCNFGCGVGSEMKKIDEALAKTVDVMKYYADVSKKLANRKSYIERIKNERNQAQDELTELRKILNIDDTISLKDVHIIETQSSFEQNA